MNHTYRLVWNDQNQRFVPAPECARAHGKANGGKARLTPAALLLGAALAAPAFAQPASTALPTGGRIVAGQAGIAQSGSAMTITQGSDKAIIDWQRFDIGSNASVRFNQPAASAIALNRVLASEASQIYGQLSANGQVWLINPAGIVFGPGSRVDVAGLVASTLDTTNADFLAGKAVFSRQGATGGIRNQGEIRVADGGLLALLAPEVINEGLITARLGKVALATGERITLDTDSDGLLQVSIDPATLQTLIDNRHLIIADGGQVIMSSRAADALSAGVVANHGTVQARTIAEREGRILLLADMTHGEVIHSGLLDASAPNAGNGGFVETSAAKVTLEAGRKVTTQAANGHTGTWLIDPNDYTIAASGGDITGADLSADLASNNIEIQSSSGATSGNGDIFVNDAVTWSTNRLTLSAIRNIDINANLNGSGSAQLALAYGQGAVAAGNTADYRIASGAKVDLPAGNNFSTKLGSDGATDTYTVITSLGAAGSTTGTDLQGMNGNLAGNYALGADIDASATSGWNGNTGWRPVGNWTTRFTGNFAGLGHTISGLFINRSGVSHQGLFGYAQNALIRDIGMLGGSVTSGYGVGGLVGRNNHSVVSNSYATGSVSGSQDVGGLVGSNDSGTISNSYATGSVSGHDSIGGLVGSNDSGTISNSYATGSVSGNDSIGGLVGDDEHGTISNSYATGNVSGNQSVGGLVGLSILGAFSNSHYPIDSVTITVNGVVQDSNFLGIGGLKSAQWNDWFTDKTLLASDYYASSNGRYQINTLDDLKNILGFADDNLSFDLNADIALTPGFHIPYFKGNFYGNGHLLSGLSLVQPGQSALGMFGILDSGSTLTSVGVDGSVSGGGFVGGLVGFSNSGSIINSYATGSVSGSDYVGGLVGAGLSGAISDSYATSNVSGNQSVGGLVGASFLSAFSNSHYPIDSMTITINGVVQDSNFLGIGGLKSAQWNDWFTDKALLASDYYASSNGRYQINTLDDLKNILGFADDNLSFDLNADIALTPGFHIPYFKGNFYGNGHLLSGLSLVQPGQSALGMFGTLASSSSLTGVGVDGNVSGSSHVGGLVGHNDSGTISNSYATGSVSGDDAVGGLVGYNKSGTISNSYATGSVSGDDDVGGLVGYNESGTISNSYATGSVSGSVSGSYDVGGLVGDSHSGTISSSFWDTTTTGQPSSAGGIGLSTSDMQQQTNFNSATAANGNANPGWDISADGGEATVWRIYEGASYPVLRDLQRDLTVSANNVSKTYDGNAWTGGNGVTYSGSGAPLSGAVSYSGTSQGASDAGSYTITPEGLTLIHSTQQDYQRWTGSIIYNSGTLTTTPAPLSITANNAAKTYDGTAWSGGNGVSYSGFVAGQNASALAGSLSYGGTSQGAIDAGNYSIIPSGLSSSNYSISYVNGVLTINPAILTTTITGNLTGTVSKTYDGNSIATLNAGNFLLTGWAGSDGATVTKTTGSYNNADAGSGKTVTVTLGSGDYSAEGSTNLANYTLPASISGNVGVITPAPLTVTANDAGKTYNGTAWNGGNGVSYTGFVAGQNASALAGSLSYGGSSQGAIDAGSYSIIPSGLSSSNYSISYVNGALTINPAILTTTITGNLTGTVSKTYDGNSIATLNAGNFLLTGWAGSDGATVTKTTGSYNNADAGSGKTVTVTLGSGDYSAAGSTNLANYTLPASISGNVGVITPAPLTVTANDAGKTYDGTAWNGGNGVSYSGFVAGQNASALAGSLSYGGSSQGAIEVGSYSIQPFGLISSNYAISYANGALSITAVSPPDQQTPPASTGSGAPDGGEIWSAGNVQLVQPFSSSMRLSGIGGHTPLMSGMPFLNLAPGFIRLEGE